MSIPFLNNIDLNKFQILNLRIQNLAAAPGSPVAGLVYYDTNLTNFYGYNGSGWVQMSGGGGGGVSSVALSMPSIFTVSGSPVTTSGTLTASLNNQATNTVFAGPDGSTGLPTFRTLTANDIPNHSTAKLTSGVLGVARGGTGVDASSATNGQLLIGNGSGFALAALTQGTGITITNGAGTISIANAGVTSLTGTANQVNVSASTGSVTLSLPQSINTTATPTFASITISNAPSASTDAVNKTYVDNLLLGLRDYKESVKAATTANITLSAPQTIDGISVVAGDRVLVFNQTTASQNGIYIVNAGAWTRSTDFATGTTSAITLGVYVYVEAGTVNGTSGFILSASNAASPSTSINIGTDNITFTKFAGATIHTFSTGLRTNGTSISVGNFTLNSLLIGAGAGADATILAPGSQYNVLVGGVSGVPTWGTINLASSAAVGSSILPIANGGTGASSVSAARTALGVPTKYTTTITGDGTTTAFTVTHNIGSQNITWSITDSSSPRVAIFTDTTIPTGGNTLTFTFGTAPTNGTVYNVTVIG